MSKILGAAGRVGGVDSKFMSVYCLLLFTSCLSSFVLRTQCHSIAIIDCCPTAILQQRSSSNATIKSITANDAGSHLNQGRRAVTARHQASRSNVGGVTWAASVVDRRQSVYTPTKKKKGGKMMSNGGGESTRERFCKLETRSVQ